jgi:hypothetical protein
VFDDIIHELKFREAYDNFTKQGKQNSNFTCTLKIQISFYTWRMSMSSIKEKVIEFVKHMSEGSTIDDIVNALEKQKEIVANMDDESTDARIDMVTLSEASLKDFLEAEPDIYTDKDLKVKFH